MLALIEDEVQVCACSLSEEEETALRDIAHRLDDDGLASCGKAVEGEASLLIGMSSKAKLRITDSEDCPLDRSAMGVGDPTTELCCSRCRGLSRERVSGVATGNSVSPRAAVLHTSSPRSIHFFIDGYTIGEIRERM